MSKKSAHTPTPWTRDEYGTLIGPSGRYISAWGMSLNASDEAKANSDLFFAAPALTALALARGEGTDK